MKCRKCHTSLIKCRTCKGSGKVGGMFGGCTSCGGTGQVCVKHGRHWN